MDSRERIGVVADDLTGANDMALLLTQGGARTVVIAHEVDILPPDIEAFDAIVLETESRGMLEDRAYETNRAAARRLRELGCRVYYNKISSTVQGYVARGTDALLDELGETFSFIVPGFPDMGREVRNGYLYVWGTPVDRTDLARHPTSPITDAFLPRFLARQTYRPVGLLDFRTLARGHQAVRKAIPRLESRYNLVVADTTSWEDLRTLAQVIWEELPVTCGGSALGRALAEFQNGPAYPGELPPLLPPPGFQVIPAGEGETRPVLVVVGSVSRTTRRQLTYLLSQGVPAVELELATILETPDGKASKREVSRATSSLLTALQAEAVAVLHTGHTAESVTATRERGRNLGLDTLALGELVTRHLGQVVKVVVEESGLDRLVVAGGDTSSHVCRALDLHEHRVIEQGEVGIPVTLSRSLRPVGAARPVLTVLKGGNFGSESFLSDAVTKIRRWQIVPA